MKYADIAWAQESMNMLGTLDAGTLQAPRAGREHYLGMSSIGGCAAELWRNYHEATTHGANIPPKLQRVFDLGNALEDVVLGYLNAAGAVKVLSTQAEYTDIDGKLRGHSDLVYETAEGKKIVSDVKSMNNYQFGNFTRLGVKHSHWKYYCQAMLYARYEEADAIQIIAYNKDTSALAVQTYSYEQFTGDMLRSRAEWIINLDECPPCERGNGHVKYCGCER